MPKKRTKPPRAATAPRRAPRTSADAEVRARADELATKMEALSRQIERAQGYISTAAHEILTPLTIAKGELELALKQRRDPDADQAALEIVLGQVKHLITLTMDILTLAAAGRPERPAISEVRLKDVVDQAVRTSLAAAPVVRAIDVAVQDLVVPGRAEDLLRLVRNVVENAIEHGPEGSRVRVEARRRRRGDDDVVVLAVEDEGGGIPRELHERIFEPFYRIQSPRFRSGTGLGLAIARELARAHGGELSVDAAHPRTRFVVVLPISRE